jgi:hypothetical protein
MRFPYSVIALPKATPTNASGSHEALIVRLSFRKAALFVARRAGTAAMRGVSLLSSETEEIQMQHRFNGRCARGIGRAIAGPAKALVWLSAPATQIRS